jgi:outer membrane protein assembly factor BamD (BamD/ComL family)
MRIAVSLLIACIATAHLARADISAQLADAARPLNEGIPEVAVIRLKNLLGQRLGEADWRAVAEKLVEAMIAANQTSEAQNLLNDRRLQQSGSAKFWRAQLLAAEHHEAEALLLYREITADQSWDFKSDAEFGVAEMLRALGDSDAALESYSGLFRDQKWSVRAQLRAAELYLDKGDGANARRTLDKVQPQTTAEKRERHFLRGRLEMVLQRPDRAITIFESVLKHPEGATHETLTGALFGLADAHLKLKTPETGDDALENFIGHRPRDVDLPRIFAKLDELYRAEKKPSRAELERWARDPEQPRRALAQWYLARFDLRLGRRDRALEEFNALRRTHPTLSALASAYLDFARFQIEEGNYDDALSILQEARSFHPERPMLDRIDLLAAEINYRAKQFDPAIAEFERLGQSDSVLAPAAMFNAALGWLQKQNEPKFIATALEFENKTKDQKSAGELRLEAGLTEASKGDARASESLRSFLRDFPTSERVSEAWVALAELAFHAAPPRLDEARKDLAKAMELRPTAAAQEHADYLQIWLEDTSSGDERKVITRAKKFIQDHDKSALVTSVRMKLGELYYRIEDFANAETQFELLTEQNPNGPLAERALFFAGEAAMASMTPQSLDRAIALFNRVVQMNGELKWPARNEQAAIERKLGKSQDALALYDEVLNGNARPADRREAMCGKGDVFFELAGNDPQNYQRAIEAYDKLAADRDAPAHWRNQALFKKGLCLEKRADRAGALASFYTVLDQEALSQRAREFFWFYKAGFNAGQLLEADAKWESAAAVYERLAAAGGSRADEAKQRLDRLRLEHFLRQE